MPDEKQHLTFISYSKTSRGFALELAKELKAAGFLAWLDQLDIPTGARWDDEVEKALTQCEIFMVILTQQSIASHNVKDEIGYAIDSNKRILPILLEKVNVPFRLRRFQYVDFTNKSNEEGIEAAKQLLRKLMDDLGKPEVAPQPTPATIQPEGDRPSIPKSDPNLLAQRRAEAIRKAREQEQQARSKQTAPPTPAPSQPQPQSSPKLLPIIAGVIVIALLCLGGGYVAWPYIFPTDTPLVPTTKAPTLVTPPTTITTTETPTEIVPTTPAPPSVTIPSDPVGFLNFYFENINIRNYDLTWSLLSDQFKDIFNSNDKESYIATWNKFTNQKSVVIYSTDYTKISDTSAIVVASTNIQSAPLNYYFIRENTQSNWLFYPLPDSFNVSCSRAPKSLSVGITAEVVTASDDLLLRNIPTDGIAIEGMPPGTIVDVVDGPECKYYRAGSVFLWWWKVRSPQGNQGWIVEGYDSKDPVFIQPVP